MQDEKAISDFGKLVMQVLQCDLLPKIGSFKIREKPIKSLILNGREIHEKIEIYRGTDCICDQAKRNGHQGGGGLSQDGYQRGDIL